VSWYDRPIVTVTQLHYQCIHEVTKLTWNAAYNCLHNLAPSYLSTMCQPVADNAGRRHLRSAARGDLAVPVTRTVCYGPRSFAMAGLLDRPCGTLLQYRYAAAAFHPRSVVI